MLCHASEMPIALGRSALRRVSQHCGWSWWSDHFRIRIALGDGVVDASLIIGSITDERRKRGSDLVEQGLDLRAIIDITIRYLRREDLPSVGVDPDVQGEPVLWSFDMVLAPPTSRRGPHGHTLVQWEYDAWPDGTQPWQFCASANGVRADRALHRTCTQNAKHLSQTIKHVIRPGSQWSFLMAVCPRRVSGSRKEGFRE
jgi:hypothetical protein